MNDVYGVLKETMKDDPDTMEIIETFENLDKLYSDALVSMGKSNLIEEGIGNTADVKYTFTD